MAGWADAVWLQGKRWGTVGVRRGDRTIEITTHRAEAYQPDSRKPDVVFGDSIEVDLSRRDFTVNAMALRLPDLELVDQPRRALVLRAHHQAPAPGHGHRTAQAILDAPSALRGRGHAAAFHQC